MNCLKCNKSFSKYQSEINRGEGKYCSHKCSPHGVSGENHWKKKLAKKNFIEISCKTCGTNFNAKSYKNREYCSKSCCRHKPRFGENNPNWKGGITPILKALRTSKQYFAWREMVLIRDNYICQECNLKENLHAHHIIHLAQDLSKAFDLENGITLCANCHQKKHPELKLTFTQLEVN